MSDISELTGGTIMLGPATLYRPLQWMRVDGLVEEIPLEERPRADRRAERRRCYQITPAGRDAAKPRRPVPPKTSPPQPLKAATHSHHLTDFEPDPLLTDKATGETRA